MRILFLTPYPYTSAPSQRFRFEQYYSALDEKGILYDKESFWTEQAWKILYAKGKVFQKIGWLFYGLFKRFFLTFRLRKYDYIFIHREADPLGVPLFPWLYKSVGKKIIFDFDDAIWIPNASQSNRMFMRFKNWNNTKYICKLAYKVSAGNEYLCGFARTVNKNVVYNPTTIDTENLHNRLKDQHTNDFVIGWTGTHSTIKYLEDMLPIFEVLAKEINFTLAVICDKKTDFDYPFLKFIPWNKPTEIEDLLNFNIGLMPLTEDKWSSGKCGFKALQYMSLGIPALVSPVGVNTRIVDHGINGFICANDDDWKKYIKEIYNNRDLLYTLSANTRKKIEEHYSVKSNTENFLSLFS